MKNKTLAHTLLAAGLALAALPATLHAAECGLLFDLSGPVKCQSTDGKALTLKPFAPLPPQASCQLEKDARLTFTHYASQSEYRVSGPGTLGLECNRISAPKSTQVRQVSTASQQNLKAVAATFLVQGAMTMRNPTGLNVLNLEGDSRLLDGPANIRYSVPPDTENVRFVLKNDSGVEIYTTTSTQSPLPLPSNLIQPGQTYRWQLDSLEAGSSSPTQTASGKFSVSDDARARTLRAARPGANADGAQWMQWIAEIYGAGYEMDARSAVENLRAASR